MSNRPLITVLVPLIDTRGDAAEHIRSWTRDQSLARERYQVIVAAPPGDVELQRRVTGVLTCHDRLLCVDTDEVGLYDAAAAEADADWLLPTESHCVGHRDCLANIVGAIESDESLEALTLDHGHIVHNAVDELCARWFGEVYDSWEQPDEWTRLNLVGFAIRRDAYFEEGGLDRRYGLFCSFLLSARMDLRGANIQHLPTARVDHVHTHGIREHHEHTADHAHGACEVRADFDRAFCERYFGHAHTWANAARFRPDVARPTAYALARATVRALRERNDALPGLAWELTRWLPAAALGVRPYLTWRKQRFLTWEFAAEKLRLPGDANYRQYLRAIDEIGTVTELEWIRERSPGETPTLPAEGSWQVAELDGELVATHGLETHDGRRFRWSEPTFAIRREAAVGGGELRIDTGGLRGSPLSYVREAYVGSRRVPHQRLREEEGRMLHVPLPHAIGDGEISPIVLISEPLLPARHGSADARRLGIPVFSLELLCDA